MSAKRTWPSPSGPNPTPGETASSALRILDQREQNVPVSVLLVKRYNQGDANGHSHR